MAEAGHFDWPALMRLGLRHLNLAPRDFWALTPAELTLKLGLDGGKAPMGRARLEQLAQAFPDRVQMGNPDDNLGENDG